jgi:hypothetical protein
MANAIWYTVSAIDPKGTKEEGNRNRRYSTTKRAYAEKLAAEWRAAGFTDVRIDR